MGLETGDYIDDLVSTNPVGATDYKSAGDDHIRLIKKVLLQSFPNIAGAMTLSHTQLNDAARKSAAQTFSAVQTFSSAANIRAANQAAGDPAYSFTNDTDSGMYLDSDGVVGISAAGTLRASFSAAEIDLTATALDFNGAADFSSTVTVAGTLSVSANAPIFTLSELDAGTDEKNWRFNVNNDALLMRAMNDAESGGSTFLSASRSGTTVTEVAIAATEIDLTATTLDFNGAADFSSTLQVNAALTLRSTTTPLLYFNEADGAADEKIYRAQVAGGTFSFITRTDADGTGAPILTVLRTGTTVDEIQLDSTTLDFNGALDVDGSGHNISGGLNAEPESRNITDTGNTAATDQSIVIRMTSGASKTFTLNGDPPTNAVVVLDNSSGNAWTIAGTLIWALTAGTGNRTLADDGMAVALHRGSGVWVISGGGLT